MLFPHYEEGARPRGSVPLKAADTSQTCDRVTVRSSAPALAHACLWTISE